jgi:hypothetical protein
MKERMQMKKIVGLLTLSLIFGLCAYAGDGPQSDLYAGYSFLRVNSAQQVPAFTANGGNATFAWNFNQHFGLEAEFSGYHNGNINNHQFDTTALSYLFGPRFSLGRRRTFDPYIHTLFGVMNANTGICCLQTFPAAPSGTTPPAINVALRASQANFAMAIGGGLDIKLSRTVILRAMQLDYFLTRFETPNLNNPGAPFSNRNQNNLRFATGFAFNFGGERPGPPPPPPPPPPAMKPCPGGSSVPVSSPCPLENMSFGLRADPTEICPGAVSRIAPAGQLPPNAVTQWTLNGEPLSQGPTLEFGSTGRNPGSYKIGLRVSAEGYNDASADTSVSVRPYTPPSGTLSVSPAEIWVGEKANLSPSFSPGQCGGPLGQVGYSAQEGSVSGNEFDSTTVRFDPADTSEQRKTVTITAKVSDQKDGATATASVVVKQKGALLAKRLPDIVFTARNERVNNCGKRVLLEALKNMFESDPSGTVVLVGHVADNETAVAGLDLKRALNAAAVISAGTGICARFPASRILAKAVGTTDTGVDFQPNFCGASTGVIERPGQAVEQSDDKAQYRRVEVWFVPTGGVPPGVAQDAKPADSLGVSSLGCPR